MTLRRPAARPPRRPSVRLALEPRIVFDGAMPAAAAAAEHHEAPSAAPQRAAHAPALERVTEAPPERVAPETSSGMPRLAQHGEHGRSVRNAVAEDTSASELRSSAIPAAPAATASQEIVFVDSAVVDIEAYLPGFKGQVVTLNANSDGLDQIAAALAGRHDLTAIHIISHGEAGLLLLGNSSLDLAGITGSHAADLAAIKDALAPQGDLLLYGCDVAAGTAGQEFITALAKATSADVAASTDDTGAADLGGNWTLEAHVGDIHTQAIDASGWEGLLAQVSSGTWNTNGNGNATTATSTVGGITTTVSFGSFSNGTTGVNNFTTTGTGATLNNIAAFSPAAVQNTASLGFTFDWDTNVPFNGGTGEAAARAGTGVITITFSSAVTNPIVHLDRLGGSDGTVQNGMRFTLVNPGGLSITQLSGTPGFAVDSTAGTVQTNQIDVATANGYSGESSFTANQGTAAGSIQVNGTVTTLQFVMSAAPNSNEGTGGDAVELKVTYDPPPIAVNDTFATPHDTPITLNVRANDSDPQNDPITVTKVNGTAITAGGASIGVTGGSVALSSAGNLVFSPNANTIGATSFAYTIADPNGGESTATVSGNVTDFAPIVDLNSGSTSTQRVTNGSFTGNANGWVALGTTGTAAGNAYYWELDGGSATLTQAALTGFDKGYGAYGAAQVTYDLAWNNGATDSTNPATLDLSVGGVVYARLTTNSDGAGGTVGAVTYLNGASGPITSIVATASRAWTYVNIVVNLPANVAATGNLQFAYNSNGGTDDISIDNVSVLTRTDTVTGNNYNTAYTENGAPLSIAATPAEVRDNDNTNLVSATVTLTNPQAGDLLTVTGALTGGITASAYNATTGVITLTGSATLAQYTSAIQAIGYSSTSDNPSTVNRTINVVASDGISVSNTAVTTITVTAVNDPPTAANDSFATPHNVPITLDVRANDFDPENDNFTVTKVNGTTVIAGLTTVNVTGGSVVLNNAGNLVFTPTAGYTGATSFTYAVDDVFGAESTATVTGTVTDAPPVIDLNSTSASNQDVVNGGFTGGATGWTAAGNGTANGSYYFWDTDSGTGTLTQANLTNLNRGYGTQGAAAVTFDLGWNNGTPDTTVPATLDLTIGGVLYARFTTNGQGANGTSGSFTYFNGASGPVDSVASSQYQNWTFTHLTVNLPANVAATGNLVLSYNAGTGGYDDIAIDNVSVLTRTDPVAGVNYATSYTENAVPVSIASPNTEAYDNDDTNLVSATVVLTNAQAGDVLTQIALGSSNITVSQYNQSTHTVTLTGSDTAANYAAAIQTIGFANTTDSPSTTPRTITVTVNDGYTNSAVAATTVNVVSVNDAPVVNLSNNANLLADGDFENTVQPNLNANNLKGTTYGAFTSTNANINIIHVDGTGYVSAPDNAYSGVQYLDLQGTGSIAQGFTLASAQTVSFGGAFSNRQNDTTGYVAPTTTISILNSSGTVVATASPVTLTRASGDENWYLSTGTVSLAAGSYTFQVAMSDYAQLDTVYVRNTSGYTASYTENAAPTPITTTGDAVTDLDNTTMTSATIVLTNAQSLDVLSVIGTLPSGITASSYNSATGTLTLSGTATSASYATALTQIGYSSTSENPSATPRVINVTVSDGTSNSNTAVATINVIPVNDAPVAVADTITLNEDRPLDFNPRSNDTDAENDPLTIKQINGTAITPDSIGVNVTGGVVVMDFNGNLEFIPNADYSGTSSFTYQIADPSGATSTATVTVNVTPVNDAPVVDLNGPSTTTTAPTADGVRDATPPSNAWDVLLYSGSFAVAGAASPNDANRTTGGAAGTPVLNGEIYLGQDDAPLIIRDDYIQATDKPQNVLIRSGNQYGGTYVVNASNGDYIPTGAGNSVYQYVATRTMSAAGTITLGAPGSVIDDYAEIFVNATRVAQNLSFTYNLSAPLTASFSAGDVVEIRLTNVGGQGGFTVDATITNINYATAYTENGAPLSIASSSIVVNDVDNTTMASATVTLTNAQSGDLLSVIGTLPSGIAASAYNVGTGVLTLSGIASRASYATAIGEIGYSSTSENPSTTPRIVNTIVNDGTTTSPVAVTTISVTAVNDAPTSAAPTSVSSSEDTTLAFGGANTLTVSDVDSANLTVSLNVAHGTLTLGTTTGLTFSTGTGSANTAMTFSGTQAQLNTALASLTYRPAADYNGSDTLGFSTNDGSLTTTKSVALTVTPVADITADNVTTSENAAISFNAITGTNGASPDMFSDPSRAVTAVTQGAHGTVSFTAAGVLTYTPNTNYNGTDTFTYTVTAGGTTETATETVTISAVNQAPTSVAPTVISSPEDTTLAFTGGNALSVSDVDTTNLTVTLNVAHGTLTLGTTTGLTFTTGTGTANTSMTFSGTQAQLNIALASLSYRPSADYNGSDTLGFSTNDGSLTTAKSIALTVTPVADIRADSVTTNENTAIAFNAITGTNGATADTFSDPSRAVTSVTQGAHGTVSFNANGTLTYTPNTNYSGTDTFNYTVTAGGTTETATETVTIAFVNQAPTSAAPAAVSSPEDATLNFTGGNALSVADVDSPNLTVTLNVGHGTLTLGTTTGLTFTTGNGTANTSMTFSGTQAQLNNALASLSYRPSADYNGSDTLGFGTNDGSLTTTKSVALTVTPVADITADSVTTNENAAISFNAITGTNGATADTFSDPSRAVTSVTQGAHGSVAYNANGTLTYTPNTNYSGTDTFTYTVTAGGTTETATETVTINFVNQAPTSAAPTSVSSPEDTTLAFTGGNALSVADVDSPNLTVTLNVAHGTLTLGTITGLTFTTGTGSANATMTFSGTQAQLNAALASLTYRPSADYNGSDTLGFSTNDGSLTTAKSVALTVTPVADIRADSVTTGENTAIAFNAITGTNGATADTFSDPSRAVTSVTQGAHGTVSFNANGTLTYTPNTNYFGSDTFTYTVTAGGTTETATETVTVNFIDLAPTSTAPASATSPEDTTLAFTGGNALSVADIDSPNLTVTLNVGHGTLTLGTTTGLTFTTGNGTANTAMTFSGTQAQLNNALASLTYRPSADYNGSDTLSFTTSDGSLNAAKSVALSITPVADITADTVTTNENTVIAFNAMTGTNGATADTFSDPSRAVTSVTQGSHGSVSYNANGVLTYTPNTNYSGTDTFTYTVTAGGTTETATETVNVAFVNQAPTSVAPAAVSSPEDTTLTFTGGNALSVADVDSANLTVTLNVTRGTLTLGTITGLTFTTGTGTANTSMTFSGTQAQLNAALASLSFRPNADYNGNATLGFTTSDGSLSAAKSVALTITPVTDITADSVTTSENTAIAFNAITGTNGATADTFSDPARAVTSVTQGAHGSVSFNANGLLTYTPNTNYSGTDTFNYTVTAGGTTETASETVTVAFVNQPPTSTAPAVVTSSEDTTLAFTGGNTLSVADVDSANLTVTLNVSHGTLTLGTTTGLAFSTGNGTANTSMTFSGTQAQLNSALASLSFRPDPDYNGSATLGFTTSDGSLTAAKSVALTITPVADITADNVSTLQATAISFNAITGTNGATADTFSDPTRAVTAVTQGANGTVSFTAAGVLTYTPTILFNGTDTFTYTVTAGGSSEMATETVTVGAVNQAPTSSAPTTITSAEDTAVNFTGGNTLSVFDVDSPVLTVSLNVSHGKLTLGTTTGLTFSTGNGTANTSMTFSGTQAQLNLALASLGFLPDADYNGNASLGFSTTDGSLTAAKTVALTITPVADITADSVTTNENTAISFNPITGTNGATADTFSDPGRAVTAVTQGSNGTVAYNANGVLTYTPNTNFSGTDTFSYTVTAGGTTEIATETVTVNFVNQAPTSTAPAAVTATEDTTRGFRGANTLTVSDVDSPNLTVTLNVSHGTLTLGTITGLTFTTGNGAANTSMTFSGSQAALNNALASLNYLANADYNGSDTLNFTTSDGSLTAAKSVALTITPVADITADSVTTNENTAIAFNAITGTNGATADTFSDPSRAVTAVTQGSNGTVGYNANGVLTYTPNANYSGTDTFTYTVTAGGTTETATETVTVNFVNQAPTSAAPTAVTSSEDTTLAFTGGNALTVSDVDNPNLTVSLNVGHGTLTLGTTTGLTFSTGNGTANAAMTFSGTQAQLNAALASLTYRPAADYNGSDTLGFSTNDGSLTTTKSVALNITPVADITADSVTTNENTAIAFNAITGTNGATADSFSDPSRAVTSVTQGAHGSVSYNPNGVLTYTPNANYSGSDTFDYTVTAGGTTETATETVTVNFVNQAPTSTAPTGTTSAEDTTLGFAGANALAVSDVDSPSLTVSLNVGHGTLTLGTTTGLTFSTGNGTANASMTFSGTQAQLNNALASLSFSPNADFNGSDTLNFTTGDGSLNATKSIALTITPVADITADSVATNENVAISFNAITGTNGATADTFSDPGRAVTAVTQGSNGTVGYNANGVLTYTPNSNFSGTDTFTYTVTAGGTTETATESVNVAFVNQAPTSTAPTAVTSAEDTTVGFGGANAFAVSDVDSPSLTVTLNVDHGMLTLGTNTGLTFATGNGTANTSMTFSGIQAQLNAALASLTFQPGPDYNGSATLGFTTSDGSLSTSKSVALTITPVADITADSVTTNENAAISFNAITGTNGATADTFSDPTRAVTAVTQGANGTVNFNAAGVLTYTPNANFSGSDSFNYTVTAGGTTETAMENVTVNFVNQAPTSAAPSAVTSAEDTTVAFSGANAFTVGDVDSPSLTVTLNVSHGTLTLGTTTGLAFSTGNGTANTSMTFTGTQAQLNSALASLSFRPDPDYNGSATLGFATSDGALTTSRAVALTITPVADITADSIATNENTAISFNAITGTNGATPDTFSDPSRAVTSVTQGLHGTVTFTAAGVLTYTPNASFYGSDSYSYTVTSGGSTETAAVTMNVVHVNQAPVANGDSFTVAEDATATINVRANDTDADNDVLTVTQVNGQAITAGGAGVAVTGGTITLGSGGDLVYTPTANFRGSTSFTYTVADPSGATSSATVSGTITPVNHAPTATNDTATVDEDHATSGNVLTNDSDQDGDPLTVSAVNGSGAAVATSVAGSNGGLFTIQANGSYSFATNGQFDDLGAGQSRTSTVTYTAADGNGGTANATITVTVTGVNDAPVANPDSFDTTDTSGAPNGLPLSNSVLTNDTDAEHDTITVSAVNGSALLVGAPTIGSYGTLTLNANGTFTYAVDQANPAVLTLLRGQAPLTDQFTYTDSDGHGGTNSTTLTIRVQGTNDGPMAGNDSNAIVQGQASASGNVISGVRTDGSGTTTTVPSAADTDPGFTLDVNAIRLPGENTGSTVTSTATGSRTGQYGTITIDANGNYTYALNNASAAVQALVPGQPVTESFVYSVTDGTRTTEATITVSIDGRNDPPVAQNDTFTTLEGTSATINVRANDSDPDHDPIRVTAVNGTPLTAGGAGVTVTGGVVTLDTTGDLVYTPSTYYRGSPTFSYTIEDPSGANATATVSGTITPVNHAPTAVADSFTTTENAASPINVLANDSDVDGDAISVTQVNGNAITSGGAGVIVNGGVVTLAASGNLVFTPDTNFTGAVSFNYTIADSSGATASAVVSGSTSHVNQPPVAVADQFVGPQDTVAIIDVRANDSDPDGDAITVTQVNGTAITVGGPAVAVTGGTVILDSAGKLEFTPTSGYRGSTSFSYTVADPFGATGTATVSGTVTAVNHAPVANPDTFTSAANTPATIDVRTNDTDADGDTLTVTQINGTAITAGGAGIAVTGGTVTLDTSGRVVFTPTTGYAGSTSFSYTVADPSGATSVATVSGSVAAPVNHAPVGNPDSFTTVRNTSTTINVRANDTDADNDPLTVTQINGAAISIGSAGVAVTGGTVTLDTSGNVVFTPTVGYVGSTSFSYTVADPSGATGSATVNGSVAVPGNHAPVANPDSFTSAANTPATVNVRANDTDADNDPLTITQINGTAITAGGAGVAVVGGTVTLDGSGNVVFTPTAGYAGPTSFTYTVADPSGATGSATVSGTVTGVNHAPIANPDSFTSAANTPATIAVRANDTDADGDPLTVTQINGAAISIGSAGVAVTGGTVTLDTSGNVVFTPTVGYVGSTSFSYTVADPSGATGSATVNGSVAVPGNHAPVANPDSFTSAANTPATVNVRANDTDADNDPLTITQINGTAITAGGAGVAVVGGTVTLDGSGNVVFTPTAGYAGPTSFTYTVADPSGATGSATVSGTVTGVNHAPIANPDSFTSAANTPATIAVRANDTDADGDPLTVTQINGAAISIGSAGVAVTGGTVTLDTSGNVVFTPTVGYVGSTSFSYTVADPSGATGSATVNGSVAVPGNHAPVANPDSFTSAANTPATVNVRANDTDADNDPLTITQINGTAITAGGAGVAVVGGTVTLDGSGNVVFTPTAGYAGPTSFTYTVADPSGATGSATVSGTIAAPGNHAPAAVGDAFTVPAGTVAVVDVRSNDADVDGDALTVTQINGLAITAGGPGVAVAGGIVTLDASGVVNFTPAANFAGTTSFTYTVRDPSGATSTASVNGTVTRGLHEPVAVPDTVSIPENAGPTILDVRGNDIDVDGNPLTITQINGTSIVAGGAGVAVAGGTVTLDASGNLVFTPTANVNGPVGFSYTVSDPAGSRSSAQVSVAVTPAAHAPAAVPDSVTIAENAGPTAINVRANDLDPDNNPLTITKINGVAITANGPAVAVTGGSVSLDAGGNLFFTPTANANGPANFSYTIVDPSGSSSTAGVSINVTPGAHAPVANPDSFTVAENAAATVLPVRANDTDPDNNILTVTMINGQAISAGGPGIAVPGGIVNLDVAGKLLFVPTANFNGPVKFSYTISDPFGSVSTATVTLNVTPLNIGPVARPDTASGAGAVTVDVLANDTDASGTIDRSSVRLGGTAHPGDPLVVAGQGTFTIDRTTGAITFTPVVGFVGTATATYTVADNLGLRSSPVALSTTVRSGNHAPVANPDAFTVAANTTTTVNVLANDTDADNDPLTVTQINGQAVVAGGAPIVTAAGSFSLDTSGNVRFTPATNYTGPVSFSYTVRDPSGATSTATVSGTVTPVNHAPVANPDRFVFLVNTPVTVDVLANDTDADGNRLTVTQINGVAIQAGGPGVAVTGGVVTLDSAGRVVFTPTPDSLGPVAFSYTVSDPSGATSTATVSGINGTVTAVADVVYGEPGAPVRIAPLSNDIDGQGLTLRISAIDGHAITAGGPAVAVNGGTVTLSSDGTLLFVPTSGSLVNVTSFTYTVTDQSGATSTARIALDLTGVTNPPLSARPNGTGAAPAGSPIFETPALYVLASVSDTRTELAVSDAFGGLPADVATVAEIVAGTRDDLRFAAGDQLGRAGLIRRDADLVRDGVNAHADTLFVQHAVRYENLPDNQALFVTNAVRQSQSEARLFELRANLDGATVGTSTLTDPFAVGTPHSNLLPIVSPDAPRQTEATHARVPVDALTTTVVPQKATHGFSAQLRHGAQHLHARHAAHGRNAPTVVPRDKGRATASAISPDTPPTR